MELMRWWFCGASRFPLVLAPLWQTGGCCKGYCGSSKFCPRRCRNTMLLQLLLREQLRCTIALVATQGYCNYRESILAIELAPLS
jgi:hypothetical protein